MVSSWKRLIHLKEHNSIGGIGREAVKEGWDWEGRLYWDIALTLGHSREVRVRTTR